MSTKLPAICREMDVGVLLDAFVLSRNYIPQGAQHVRSREELPLALQPHTRRVDSGIWRAWKYDSHIRFVKAKPVACEEAAGLQIVFFDVDGRLDGSRIWIWLQDRPLLRASAQPAYALEDALD